MAARTPAPRSGGGDVVGEKVAGVPRGGQWLAMATPESVVAVDAAFDFTGFFLPFVEENAHRAPGEALGVCVPGL